MKHDREILYQDRQPCDHPGCLNHITHPCEGCGRVAGHGIVYKPWIDKISPIEKKNWVNINEYQKAEELKREMREVTAKLNELVDLVNKRLP